MDCSYLLSEMFYINTRFDGIYTPITYLFLSTELLSYLHVLFTYKPQNLISSFLLGFLIHWIISWEHY